MEDCIFCKIVKKQIPSEFLYESENIIVIKDINPSADTHILIVPKKHIPTFLDLNENEFLEEAKKVAQDLINKNNLQSGYKMVFNGGKYQIVPHLHWHLLGGNMKKEAI
ncbi:HIT domain-containing protein [Candidatus Microgenomates bacterium]|nr:HIT domain-containing protein [Candidatus Microgenomates bacterium]